MKSILCSVLSSLLVLGSITPAFSDADPNDPPLCSVMPADHFNGFVLSPNLPTPIPASVNVITVRNTSNAPIPGATVIVTLGAPNVLCGSTILSGVTDSAGQVTITVSGGGCAHNRPLSAIVKANGVTIRSYNNAKSPDYDGSSGDLRVSLEDLVKFSREFMDVDPNECHDYDNDGNTGLSDLIIFSPTFINTNSCDP